MTGDNDNHDAYACPYLCSANEASLGADINSICAFETVDDAALPHISHSHYGHLYPLARLKNTKDMVRLRGESHVI